MSMVRNLAALALLGLAANAAQATTITHLSDDFSSYWRNSVNGTSGGTFSNPYSNEAVRAAWHNGSLYAYSDPLWDSSAVPMGMSSNNQIAYRDLSMPVLSTSNWSVSLRMLNTSYGSSGSVQKVWLANFDSATSTIAAYGTLWSTGAATDYGSEGLAQIRSLQSGTALTINTTGTNLSSQQSGHVGADGDDNPAQSPNDALDLPMATWELKWDATTKTLSLLVDGVAKGSKTVTGDPVASSFNRLYIIGSNTGRFDDVVVTSTPIPEPGSATAVIGAVMLGGATMRRPRSR